MDGSQLSQGYRSTTRITFSFLRGNVLFQAFTILKQYQQLQENPNSSLKTYKIAAQFPMVFSDSNKVLLIKGG